MSCNMIIHAHQFIFAQQTKLLNLFIWQRCKWREVLRDEENGSWLTGNPANKLISPFPRSGCWSTQQVPILCKLRNSPQVSLLCISFLTMTYVKNVKIWSYVDVHWSCLWKDKLVSIGTKFLDMIQSNFSCCGLVLHEFSFSLKIFSYDFKRT